MVDPKIFRICDETLYHEWIDEFDRLGAQQARDLARRAESLAPGVSIAIAPLAASRPDRLELEAFARRLSSQIYRNWRIVEGAVDDAPRQLIARAAEAADYVLPLPLDATLAPHALALFALALNRATNVELIYGDEDFLSNGKRSHPFFKTDWDPYLILGRNFVGAPALYRSQTLKRLRIEDLPGAAIDNLLHALTLRVAGATSANAILHIPSVLCHRSKIGDWSDVEGRAIVSAHLAATGVAEAKVSAAPLAPAFNRVEFPLPAPEPVVSIIVPTRDRADLLGPCVDGILNRTDYSSIELLIVDNGTIAPDAMALIETLRNTPRVRVLRDDRPFNFSQLTNSAAQVASGDILLLLNNDTVVLHPQWLTEMASLASRPEIGVVGARLLYPDRRIQHAGITFGPGKTIFHQMRLAGETEAGPGAELALLRSVSAVTGACLALRRDLYLEVGGMNEADFACSCNDIDLCRRVASRGLSIVCTPFAELLHLESPSRGYSTTPEKADREARELMIFWSHNIELFENSDPFHNPQIEFKPLYTDFARPPRPHRFRDESVNLPLPAFTY